MIATIIDRLTETNPQIMREWQRKINPEKYLDRLDYLPRWSIISLFILSKISCQ
jgi:hypothetical protein